MRFETTIGRRRFGKATLAGLCALALSGASTSAAAETALSREHIAALVARSPDSRAAAARSELARAAVRGADVLSLENPSLSALGGVRFNPDGTRPFAGSATLSWPVEVGGQRSKRKEAAALGYREARAEQDLEARRRLLRALVLHATELRDERQASIAEARRANSEKMLASARKRRAAGSVPELDVSLATLQRDRDAATAALARGERDASRARLAAALGGLTDAAARAVGVLVPEQEPPPLELALRELGGRAELRAAEARVGAAEARARRENAAAAPTVNVLAQYERDDRANIGSLGVSVPLPLLNPNTEARATTGAERDVAVALLDAARRESSLELRELYARYEATKEARRELATTLETVQAAVALASRSYELGEGDLASALVVHREALEAEQSALEVEYTLATVKLELLVATGRIRP